ncbi:hypothetical protein EDD11_004151 [Mortierella claussenii]|nr:hypothetical protein EDD11_004151 [Mortierella claussenii]
MPYKTLRLPRPQCFCGHVATAVYPQQQDCRPSSTIPHFHPSPELDSPHPYSDTQLPQHRLGQDITHGQGFGFGFEHGYHSNHHHQPSSASRGGRRSNNPPLNPKLAPTVLTANWVYECHFSPPQEGMVLPDHCDGCTLEQIEAEDLRLHREKESEAQLAKIAKAVKSWDEDRWMNPTTVSDDSWDQRPIGTLENYYNPLNIHNVASYRATSPLREPITMTSATMDRDRSKGKTVDYSRHHGSESGRDDTVGFSVASAWRDFAGSNHKAAEARGQAAAIHSQNFNLDMSMFSTISRSGLSSPSKREVRAMAIQSTATSMTTSPISPTSRILAPALEEKSKTPLTHTSHTVNGFSQQEDELVAQLELTHLHQQQQHVGQQQPPPQLQLQPQQPQQGFSDSGSDFSTEQASQQTPTMDSNVKVCGFHMHALEWHKMQKIKADDMLHLLVQRARCPVFSHSVARWLNKRQFDSMPMEPFNRINCDCGEPMVVAPDAALLDKRDQMEAYDLICSRRYPVLSVLNGNLVSKRHRAWKRKQKKWKAMGRRLSVDTNDNGSCKSDLSMAELMEPCSKVIRLTEAMYPARTKPVHSSIKNDAWLDQWFKPPPPRESYFIPNYQPVPGVKPILNKSADRYPVDFSKSSRRMNGPHGNARRPPLTSRRVTFRNAEEVIGTKPQSMRTASPAWDSTQWWDEGPLQRDNGMASGHEIGKPMNRSDTHEWPLPAWADSSMANSILEGGDDEATGQGNDDSSSSNSSSVFHRRKDPFEDEIWNERVVKAMNSHKIFQIPDNLLEFAVEEASRDAQEYAKRYAQAMQTRIQRQTVMIRHVEQELEFEQARHASLVQVIATMERNAHEMTQIKCRICFEGTLTHAVLPCLHLVMCEDCATRVNECIVCRVRKTGLQRIFWG